MGGFATSAADRASATDDQRERVRAWLEAQPEITDVSIGELRDAWHGWP
ncbi:MAG: 50S ribosome-binding protein YggL [Thermoanaerobaculia bacterium]